MCPKNFSVDVLIYFQIHRWSLKTAWPSAWDTRRWPRKGEPENVAERGLESHAGRTAKRWFLSYQKTMWSNWPHCFSVTPVKRGSSPCIWQTKNGSRTIRIIWKNRMRKRVLPPEDTLSANSSAAAAVGCSTPQSTPRNTVIATGAAIRPTIGGSGNTAKCAVKI